MRTRMTDRYLTIADVESSRMRLWWIIGVHGPANSTKTAYGAWQALPRSNSDRSDFIHKPKSSI